MPSLEQLISRADISLLHDVLGDEATKLVVALIGEDATQHDIKRFAIESIGPDILLTDKKYRKFCFELLREEEATKLYELLTGRQSQEKSLYAALAGLTISSGSNREQKLFEYFQIEKEIVEEDSHSEVSYEYVISSYPLFPHQRKTVKEAWEALNHPDYRVMIHMPTGSGKTRTTMNLISDHLRNNEHSLVLWLANREELCDQAYEEFKCAWTSLGNREILTHKFWDKHECDFETCNDGFLVASLQKLHSRIIKAPELIAKLGDKIGLIVMDEAHQAVAKSYRLILDTFTHRVTKMPLIGLSATPGRTWNDPEKDAELSNFFCQKKVTMQTEGYSSPVDYLVDHGYLARTQFRTLQYSNSLELTQDEKSNIQTLLDVPDSYLKRIGLNELRNLTILNEIKHLIKRHRRIILFASSVINSDLLSIALKAIGIESYSLTSRTERRNRKNFIEKFKTGTENPIVLCNFGILTTGFDAPKTSCAVIARPTLSLVLYSQMVGRCIRGPKAGGNSEAEIVTVVDDTLEGFGSVSDAFSNWEDIW